MANGKTSREARVNS